MAPNDTTSTSTSRPTSTMDQQATSQTSMSGEETGTESPCCCGPAAACQDIADSTPALLYSYKINHVTGVSSFPFCSNNKYCYDLLGVTADAVMADPAAMVNLVHPEDVPKFTTAVVKSMSDLSIFDQLLRFKKVGNDVYTTVWDKSQPYRSQEVNVETGELETVTIWKGFIVEKRPKQEDDHDDDEGNDILTKKKKEEELKAASQLLMESPLIPFFSMNGSNGQIQDWNGVMTELTAYSAMDAKGEDASTLFQIVSTPSNDTTTTTTIKSNPAAAVTTTSSFTELLTSQPKLECTIIHKETGNPVHLMLAAQSPHKKSNTTSTSTSTTTTYFITCQDLTQLKRVTAQRNEATRLAESERSLTEWLSHEIRNPLSIVMEAAQTLEAAIQSEDVLSTSTTTTTTTTTERRRSSLVKTISKDDLDVVVDDDDDDDDGVVYEDEKYNDDDHHHHRYDSTQNQQQQHYPDDGGLSYLQLIRLSIAYVVDILTNMLDLNKLAEGKIILRPESCRIYEDILIPTQRMMHLNIGGNGGSGGRSISPVIISLHGPDVAVHVDKLRLKQVLANLLSNALKYTSRGFIKIHVKEASGKWLVLTVSDSGSGVNIDNNNNNGDNGNAQTQLFSRYEQLGSSINGAGIGLCLCKNLITAMGGDISLNRDYQSGIVGSPGAQFVVKLPCLIEKEQSVVQDDSTPQRPAFDALSAALFSTAKNVVAVDNSGTSTTTIATTVGGITSKEKTTDKMTRPQASPLLLPSKIPSNATIRGRYRVMVVDDELMGRKLLVRRFQRLFPDAIIDSRPSGELAVEQAKTTRYDLITMDHYMKVGEMTGSETIQALRGGGGGQQGQSPNHNDNNDFYCDALIVGISGNAMRKEHVAAGADGFFQKPLPATDVLVRELSGLLPPPVGWRVLLVDDVEVNLLMMERKLQAVAVPHKMKRNGNSNNNSNKNNNMKNGKETRQSGSNTSYNAPRWEVIKCTLGSRAKTLLEEQEFDLVILDQTLQAKDEWTGVELGKLGRKTQKEGTIFILNSGSTIGSRGGGGGGGQLLPPCFDLAWSKPLPSVEEMRQDLYSRLLCCSPSATTTTTTPPSTSTSTARSQQSSKPVQSTSSPSSSSLPTLQATKLT